MKPPKPIAVDDDLAPPGLFDATAAEDPLSRLVPDFN
jgi:hypothetical protein